MVYRGGHRAAHPLFATACIVSLSGCANLSVASPPAPSLPSWRLWLGIALATQMVLYLRKTAADAKREKVEVAPHVLGALIGTILALALSAALAYMKPGEWSYRITNWVLDWGTVGVGLTVALMVLSSVVGTYSWMTIYVSFAWVYHDERLCEIVVLPGAIAGIVTGLLPLIRVEIGYVKRQRRKLQQQHTKEGLL